jgi:hypothetical protein
MSKDNIKTRLLICNEASFDFNEGFFLLPNRSINQEFITGHVITAVNEDGKSEWMSLNKRISIDQLNCVDIKDPNINDCLVFDGKIWKNTNLSGNGITNLNGSKHALQAMTFTNKGNELSIKTMNGVHMFNVPDASINSRGVITSKDWDKFDNKLSSDLLKGHIFIGNEKNKASSSTITGDASIDYNGILSLSDTNAIPGKYSFPIIEVDSKGRIVTVDNNIISGTEGSIQFKRKNEIFGTKDLTFFNGKLNVGIIKGNPNIELSTEGGDLIFSRNGLSFKWPAKKPKLNQYLKVKSINGKNISLSFEDNDIIESKQTKNEKSFDDILELVENTIHINYPIKSAKLFSDSNLVIESGSDLTIKSDKCIRICFPDSSKMILPNTAPIKHQIMRCANIETDNNQNITSIMEYYTPGLIQLGIESQHIISSSGEIIPFTVTFSRNMKISNEYIHLDANKVYLLYVFVFGKYLEVEWVKSDKKKLNSLMKSHNGEMTYTHCSDTNIKIALSSILLDDSKVILTSSRNIIIIREV